MDVSIIRQYGGKILTPCNPLRKLPTVKADRPLPRAPYFPMSSLRPGQYHKAFQRVSRSTSSWAQTADAQPLAMQYVSSVTNTVDTIGSYGNAKSFLATVATCEGWSWPLLDPVVLFASCDLNRQHHAESPSPSWSLPVQRLLSSYYQWICSAAYGSAEYAFIPDSASAYTVTAMR